MKGGVEWKEVGRRRGLEGGGKEAWSGRGGKEAWSGRRWAGGVEWKEACSGWGAVGVEWKEVGRRRGVEGGGKEAWSGRGGRRRGVEGWKWK